MNKSKKVVIYIASALLFFLAFNAISSYGFTFLALYIVNSLAGVFALLYARKQEKGYRIGTLVSGPIALLLGFWVSGGILNTFNLILYVVLSVMVY